MKATGFIRKFDDLGRIVIPKEIRKKIFDNKSVECVPMEIFIDGDDIILRKYKEQEDVCEWREEGNYYLTQCSHQTDVMHELKKDYKYCPYCGKKIKVVG